MEKKALSEFRKLLCSLLSPAPPTQSKSPNRGPQGPAQPGLPLTPPPALSLLLTPRQSLWPPGCSSNKHSSSPPTPGPLHVLLPPPGRNGCSRLSLGSLLRCHPLREAPRPPISLFTAAPPSGHCGCSVSLQFLPLYLLHIPPLKLIVCPPTAGAQEGRGFQLGGSLPCPSLAQCPAPEGGRGSVGIC